MVLAVRLTRTQTSFFSKIYIRIHEDYYGSLWSTWVFLVHGLGISSEQSTDVCDPDISLNTFCKKQKTLLFSTAYYSLLVWICVGLESQECTDLLTYIQHINIFIWYGLTRIEITLKRCTYMEYLITGKLSMR